MKPFPDFRQMKFSGTPIVALTAYDYPMARLLDEAGVDIILVGDSLGMVVLGHPDTTQVSVDAMVHHTKAVALGAKQALIVADLPANSYNTPDDAVRHSRLLIEAGAQAVKLEGGVSVAAQIAAIVGQGIPVMGHIGMLPQHVKEEGGYKIKGKTAEDAASLQDDANAVEAAGAFAVVLELVFEQVTQTITKSLSIPTIGIGSGPSSDGQILVTYDLIGLFPWFTPKFVQTKIQMGRQIQSAVQAYCEEIRRGK